MISAEMAPKEADVEGVLEEARKAEPDKTWEIKNDRIESSTKCKGTCGQVKETQEYRLVRNREGKWILEPGTCTFTTGWGYIGPDGNEVDGCMYCLRKMAVQLVRLLQKKLPMSLEELVKEQPEEWMAVAAKLANDNFPAKNWAFSRTVVRAVIPQMVRRNIRISKPLAAKLGLHEDAGFPDEDAAPAPATEKPIETEQPPPEARHLQPDRLDGPCGVWCSCERDSRGRDVPNPECLHNRPSSPPYGPPCERTQCLGCHDGPAPKRQRRG